MTTAESRGYSEPTTGLEPVTPYFDMANHGTSRFVSGSGVSGPEHVANIPAHHGESRAKQRVDSGLRRSTYQAPAPTLSAYMKRIALVLVMAAVVLTGCATPAAATSTPTPEAVAIVPAASADDNFIDKMRTSSQPMHEKTSDAEILDFGYALCGLLAEHGRTGYLAMIPESQHQYARELIGIVTSTIC